MILNDWLATRLVGTPKTDPPLKDIEAIDCVDIIAIACPDCGLDGRASDRLANDAEGLIIKLSL